MTLSKNSLEIYKKAYKNVPAYKCFLSSKGFDPTKVKTVEDLTLIPPTNKKDYLKTYPFNELLWQGEMGRALVFCSTSGSTGEPFYFPREESLSEQYSEVITSFIEQSSYGLKPSLVIIGFGMGVWIGGVITLRAFEISAKNAKLPISILPAGYNKIEIVKALKKLAPLYDQTIIVGYPPFVKDVVEEAKSEGVKLENLNIRFLFAAESFTETFRDYLGKQVKLKSPLLDTMNIYGSADIGAMATETPVSILIRRLLQKKKGLFDEIFNSEGKTPTLAQYNPRHIEFEAVDGQLLLTGSSALPLVRYEIGDHGGVFKYEELQSRLKDFGLDLEKEAKKAGIERTIQRKFPFVYVYERVDFTVTLHGINIYPEFIKEALLNEYASKLLTEKFVMQTKSNRRHNQYLEINIELKDGVQIKPEQKKQIHKLVIESLKVKSSEFQEISKQRNANKLVKLEFWALGTSKYFSPGVKQRWVVR